jgi:peptidoglycan/LPS O-acetylase OafA/YrhL
MILNGEVAVTLFFVLSGLVLSQSLERSTETFWVNYGPFSLRRVFRICPAHWAALSVIVASILLFGVNMSYPAQVSSWFTSHWSEPITPKLVLKNTFFMNYHLNKPTWTLRAELIGSFCLPFLVFTSQRVKWRGRAALLALLLVFSVVPDGNSRSLFYLSVNSLSFVYVFYLGYLVSAAGPRLMSILSPGTLASRCAAPVALVVLCSSVFWIPQIRPFGGWIDGVMAAVFISALIHGPEAGWYRIFDWPITRFYGRISYSFYLYHMVTLFWVSKAVFRLLPVHALTAYVLPIGLGLFVVSTAVATAIGWISYRYVESPAIAFSKDLSQRLKREAVKATPETQPIQN